MAITTAIRAENDPSGGYNRPPLTLKQVTLCAYVARISTVLPTNRLSRPGRRRLG
jgi:hypothetical protein